MCYVGAVVLEAQSMAADLVVELEDEDRSCLSLKYTIAKYKH